MKKKPNKCGVIYFLFHAANFQARWSMLNDICPSPPPLSCDSAGFLMALSVDISQTVFQEFSRMTYDAMRPPPTLFLMIYRVYLTHIYC